MRQLKLTMRSALSVVAAQLRGGTVEQVGIAGCQQIGPCVTECSFDWQCSVWIVQAITVIDLSWFGLPHPPRVRELRIVPCWNCVTTDWAALGTSELLQLRGSNLCACTGKGIQQIKQPYTIRT